MSFWLSLAAPRFISKGTSNAVSFSLSKPWVSHKLTKEQLPLSDVMATKEELLQYFYDMNVIRRMEMTADALYKKKLIRGFCHLYMGQEAVAVGLKASLDEQDSVITAYRCHGIAWTRGVSIRENLAELLGKETGASQGKGGSMHIFGKNFYGGNGIVGAQVPVGVGLAFAHQYREEKQVAAILYGDGAANQGQVFEAFNMASLWKLPAIFICENNLFGMGTSAERSSASTRYYERGDYIPGLKVDGMDVLAVREALQFAKKWCLEGRGPIVLEMDTYRYSGHSMSDPGTSYRTRDDIQEVRQSRDPIVTLKKRILDAGFSNEEDLKDVVKRVREEVAQAEEAALQDKEPHPSKLFMDVYVPGSEPCDIRGRSLSETRHF